MIDQCQQNMSESSESFSVSTPPLTLTTFTPLPQIKATSSLPHSSPLLTPNTLRLLPPPLRPPMPTLAATATPLRSARKQQTPYVLAMTLRNYLRLVRVKMRKRRRRVRMRRSMKISWCCSKKELLSLTTTLTPLVTPTRLLHARLCNCNNTTSTPLQHHHPAARDRTGAGLDLGGRGRARTEGGDGDRRQRHRV